MSEPSPPSGAAAPEERDTRGAIFLVVGVVGIVLLAVLIVLFQTLHSQDVEAERSSEAASRPPQELRRLQAEQLNRINGYRWIDEPNGVVAIPVDRAMELIVEEARGEGD